MQNYTPEDLTRYLYNEMNEVETKALEIAIERDWTLREKLEVIARSVNRLDKMPLLSPSSKSIEAILAYAEQNTLNVKI